MRRNVRATPLELPQLRALGVAKPLLPLAPNLLFRAVAGSRELDVKYNFGLRTSEGPMRSPTVEAPARVTPVVFCSTPCGLAAIPGRARLMDFMIYVLPVTEGGEIK
jgi:hypothetical protein